MRVTSGTAKGHTIQVPPAKDLRPAQEMVRQAVLSVLGDKVGGSAILDLFAGTGAYGIEALSRGAVHGDFVDLDHRCVEAIKKNLSHTRLGMKASVFHQDALKFIGMRSGKDYDIIFIAPPYALGAPENLLLEVRARLRDEGTAVVEHRKEVKVPEIPGLEVTDQKKYGETGVTFLRKSKEQK